MKHKANPGDKVEFLVDGKPKQGKVREVTLWRRENVLAYQVKEFGGGFHWLTENQFRRTR